MPVVMNLARDKVPQDHDALVGSDNVTLTMTRSMPRYWRAMWPSREAAAAAAAAAG